MLREVAARVGIPLQVRQCLGSSGWGVRELGGGMWNDSWNDPLRCRTCWLGMTAHVAPPSGPSWQPGLGCLFWTWAVPNWPCTPSERCVVPLGCYRAPNSSRYPIATTVAYLCSSWPWIIFLACEHSIPHLVPCFLGLLWALPHSPEHGDRGLVDADPPVHLFDLDVVVMETAYTLEFCALPSVS